MLDVLEEVVADAVSRTRLEIFRRRLAESEVDDEFEVTVTVEGQGRRESVGISVFIDDLGAPDIDVHGPSGVIERLREALLPRID